MTESLKCKVGDLTVVARSHNRSNIGKVVTVVEPYSYEKAPWLTGLNNHFNWMVTCPSALLWTNRDGVRWRRTDGPVPDSALQPIRDGEGLKEITQERPLTQQRGAPKQIKVLEPEQTA